MERCSVLDSPPHTAGGGQGTADDPILVDITPTHPAADSPVKVVFGERYRYDTESLVCAQHSLAWSALAGRPCEGQPRQTKR